MCKEMRHAMTLLIRQPCSERELAIMEHILMVWEGMGLIVCWPMKDCHHCLHGTRSISAAGRAAVNLGLPDAPGDICCALRRRRTQRRRRTKSTRLRVLASVVGGCLMLPQSGP